MEIQFALVQGPAPSGEIRAYDLARISGPLHELSIRLGREWMNTTGPGRSRRTVEELSEVRLRALTAGSTILEYTVGPGDALPLEIDEMRDQDSELERILVGLARDERPDGVSDLVADSVANLTQGLRSSASEIELTVGGRPPLRFRVTDIHRETWSTPRYSVDEAAVTAVGQLEKIDIYTHDLRIRDDVGNTLALTDVAGDAEAGSLIGHRVSATGRAVRDRAGKLLGVQDPVLSPVTSRFPTSPPDQTSLSELWASSPGPDPDGGVNLTDDEFAEFMEAMGR